MPDPPDPPDPDRTIGYAVVGLGWISQVAVLPAFANVRPEARLAGLVSGSPDKGRRLAERHGLDPAGDVYGYDAFEECLDRDDVDAVYIAVPNHLHREYTERAAARGVHVLCEKPMAVTEEDCRAMIRACDAAGVRLMIAYRLHFDPANLDAVARVQAGAIGDPRVLSSTFTLQVDPDDVRLVPPGKGGGPVYDIGVYCINAARYLFRAEPEAVWATAVTRPEPRFEQIAEAVSCMLRFPAHRLATFTCSFGAHPISVVHLVGDDGEIRMDHAFNFVGDRTLEQRSGAGVEERRVFPTTDQFGPQLAYFADCIMEDRDPEPDGEEGLVDVRIIRALYDALESGGMVALDVGRDRRPSPDQAMTRPAVEQPEMIEASEPAD